jgi:glycosyltransferase involved in cell wall biosynthesis
MISIVIATYGEDSWRKMALDRALPSVSHLENEILVGHDPEGTIASVRNELASRASGEWLCFLDADDELDANFIPVMERSVQKRCLMTPIVQQVLRGHARAPSFYPEIDLLRGNWLVVGTVLERSLFMEVGGFEDYPHGFEDWSLWFKCAKVGARVKKVKSAVYRQHINPRSKHRVAWRNRRLQVEMHRRIQGELEAWTP